MPGLAGLGTANPEHRLDQKTARGYAEVLLSDESPDLLRLLPVFENAGVAFRYLARPVEWYLRPRGWRDRTEAFVATGLDLMEQAANHALDDAGVARDQVDGVVYVCSTGLATPSLDARLANRMGLRPDLVRLPVWGLGCAGGVAGLARAADLATAHPKGRFLLLSLELCSLAFLRTKVDKKMLVAATLFGDGCAAAVVEGDAVADPSHPRWLGARSHQWPNTEYVMGWDVRDEGLDVVFDPVIPRFVAENIRAPLASWLDGSRIAGFALHPGGSKVLDALETALGLEPRDLEDARGVLRDYGNMSSPTVLYVLERLLRRRQKGPVLAAALGPGFASEAALLEAAA
jgi:alkylresorcinol/alkylpyrone synthase